MNPMVFMNSSTGMPLSTVTFLKACSDISCFAGGGCATMGATLSTQAASAVDARRLLLVVPIHSVQRPALPESALDGIDAVFFPHISVRRAVLPLTPETFLDLLRAVHELQLQFLAAPR